MAIVLYPHNENAYPDAPLLRLYATNIRFLDNQRDVTKLRNPALRGRAEELLKTLRRSLENADGLDVIFARHMPDKCGKYDVINNIKNLCSIGAVDYAKRFRHLCIPYAYTISDGMRLGKWLGLLKTQRKQNGTGRYLTGERIAALDKPGMVWDARQTQWERQYQAVQAYYRGYGHLRVEKGYLTPDGICLDSWIQRTRQRVTMVSTWVGG